MQGMPKVARHSARHVELRRTLRLIFVRRIHQHHAGHFLGITSVVDASIQAAERRSNQNKWVRHASALHELMKITGDRRAGSWIRTWIAPSFACAIVPARSCEFGDFSLDRLPSEPGARAG